MRLVIIAVVLGLAAGLSAAVSPTGAEMEIRREWAEAKFEGKTPTPSTRPMLEVVENYGAVQVNGRAGKPLRLGDATFTRGLYCHAKSKLVIRNLPEETQSFHALVGVDSNEQTSGGRGSVDFSVHAGNAELFRSGVMREGVATKSIDVQLNGARELTLEVDPTPDGITCDQSDWAEARVVLKDGSVLWLGDMPVQGAQRSPPSIEPPFSFVYGGKAWAELRAGWKCNRASRVMDRDRTEITTTWTDGETGLEVRCVGVEYSDFPTAEWTVYFKNGGAADTPIISDVQAVDLSLTGQAGAECVLNYNSGDNCTPQSYEPHRLVLEAKSEHRFAPAGGRPTNGEFPYYNIEWPGEGVIVAIGWPGEWTAAFTRNEGNGLRVRGGQELTHFVLHPGEEVRSPLIAMQFWHGDRVRAQNIWRRWMLAHNAPRDRENAGPRPIFSSCSGLFYQGLRTNEAGEKQFINAFTKAGVKLDFWWLDAGWYTCTDWPQVGTWTPDAQRYPKGFKPVSELAHANGMGLIVWFEPERVTPGTFLYAHPTWLLGKDGEQKLLNLGNPEARQWLTDHVDGMLTNEGIDFYRQDFNIDPLLFWRGNDGPDRQGITEIRHVEGYLAYWDELRRRHPGLLIDSCSSGGRRNDLQTLRRAVPLLRSDYQAFDGNPAYALGNQGHTYGLSSWIPYYGQGVYFTDQQFVYSARSYMSPAFAICADVRKPNIDWALIRKLSEQWRKIADCYLGDFYPLTSYQLNEELWMAWQFDLPGSARGMVQAFRREGSVYESARLKLRELDAQAHYRVTDLDHPEAMQSFTGAELMEQGLLLTAPARPAAMLLAYEKID